MTSDDEWAAVRPAHRLSYEVFCDAHERAWRGLAWSRLHEHELVEEAVRRIREDLKQDWARALRQPEPAFYASMIAKQRIAELSLGTANGETPPRTVLPDWVVAIQRAHAQARISLENLDGYDDLYAAILRLSDRQYDLIVLRYMLDIDYPTIAAYLGITEANARSTTSQGLAKLRRLLGASTTTEDMK
ncbi:sigma-70 family RNA polymerase sigma factor (plasmid) [Streptomyces viridifaciens]|nr:sigma-70 family RNA polymerase sigma factor [Streptomyces viridifaciens]